MFPVFSPTKGPGEFSICFCIGKISYDVSFISHSIWKIASHMLESTTNRYFLCWIMQTVSFVMSYAHRVCLCSCFFNGSFFRLAAYLNISIRFKFESFSHFWDSVEALSWYSFPSIVFIRLSEISWCFCRTHFFACFPSVLYRIDNDVIVWCMRFGGFFSLLYHCRYFHHFTDILTRNDRLFIENILYMLLSQSYILTFCMYNVYILMS